MTYDLAGRMIERDYSDSTTDTFTYDAASRLTQSTKGRYGVTTDHTYADDSQPLTEVSTFDGRTYGLTRTYDAANRPVTHTFGDGKVQTWDYDERNLVTTSAYESGSVLTQSHDPGQRLTGQTFGNGLTRTIAFNRLDNLRSTDIVYDGSQPVETLSMSYSYSPEKQVTAETFPGGSLLAATGFTADYDPGDRITTYTRIGGLQPPDQTWAYDDNGNWTSNTLAGQTENRTHNADNEITSSGTAFDARGNMTEDADGNEYHYDLDNRIFKIEMDQGATVEFLYDALSRRVQRKQGSTKTAYLWWGDQECSEHKHQAGQATIQNDLWAHPTALNTIIARAVDGSKFKMQWYHKNYLDHVFAVSDDSGDILEHYRYSAFGIVEFYTSTGTQAAASQIANPVLWNSRRYDEATKLHYYKYRHYSSKLGRWLSRDKIGEQGGINLYAFVGNNGVNRWDKYGLLEVDYKYPKDPRTIEFDDYKEDVATHNHGNTSMLGSVTCSCSEDCVISCEVDVNFILNINLNSDDIDGYKNHERRHVLSRVLGVKRRIVNPLKAETPSKYPNIEDCTTAEVALEKKYKKMLVKYARIGNHRKSTENGGAGTVLTPDAGANEYSPWDGDPMPAITDVELSAWRKLVDTTEEIRPIRNSN